MTSNAKVKRITVLLLCVSSTIPDTLISTLLFYDGRWNIWIKFTSGSRLVWLFLSINYRYHGKLDCWQTNWHGIKCSTLYYAMNKIDRRKFYSRSKMWKKTLGENFKNNAIDCVWARKIKKIHLLKLFYAISPKK